MKLARFEKLQLSCAQQLSGLSLELTSVQSGVGLGFPYLTCMPPPPLGRRLQACQPVLFTRHKKKTKSFSKMLSYDQQFGSIGQVQKAIEDGTTTVEAVVQVCLQAIEDLNPKINAVTVVNENALADAKTLDVRSASLNSERQY